MTALVEQPVEKAQKRIKFVCALTRGAPVSSWGCGLPDNSQKPRAVDLGLRDANGNRRKKSKTFFRTIEFAKNREFRSDPYTQGVPEFGLVNEMTEAEVEQVWKMASYVVVRWTAAPNGNTGHGPNGAYTRGTLINLFHSDGTPAQSSRRQVGTGSHVDVPFTQYLTIKPVTQRELDHSRNQFAASGGPDLYRQELAAYKLRESAEDRPARSDLDQEWAELRKEREELEKLREAVQAQAEANEREAEAKDPEAFKRDKATQTRAKRRGRPPKNA